MIYLVFYKDGKIIEEVEKTTKLIIVKGKKSKSKNNIITPFSLKVGTLKNNKMT